MANNQEQPFLGWVQYINGAVLSYALREIWQNCKVVSSNIIESIEKLWFWTEAVIDSSVD